MFVGNTWAADDNGDPRTFPVRPGPIRGAFQEEIERQWAAATRYGRALALVLLDVDEFKQINDSNGHAAGDLLLRRMGSQITASLRRPDRAFRIGGTSSRSSCPRPTATARMSSRADCRPPASRAKRGAA